jgi:hypothetical protein
LTGLTPGASTTRVAQPSAGQLERRIRARGVELAGILVAAGDREDAGADHVGERMDDAQGIATIGNAARKTPGDDAPARRRPGRKPQPG